jgi:hypothetical protein
VVIGERGLDREAIAAALQAQSNSR